MKDFFKELFEYSYQMNQKLIAVMVAHSEIIPEKCIRLQSHILNAHRIWNYRIDPVESPFDVWQIQPVVDWKNIDQINYRSSLRIIERCDLNDFIHYTNSSGHRFTNTIGDILFHAINHSTYHRGQLASEFRQIGLEPLVTDYIHYKR